MFEKIDAKFSLIPSICFVLFSFMIKTADISLLAIMNLHNDVFKKSIISTAGMSTYQAIFLVLTSYAYIFLALTFFVLGMSFISSYGTKRKNYEDSIIPPIIGSLSAFFFLGFSIMTVLLSMAMIISSMIVFHQSNIYFNEAKKWKYFRTGSNSIGNSLLVFNIIIALGAIIAVNSNNQFYGERFVTDLKNTMTEIAVKDLGGDEQLENLARSRIEQAIENSLIIEAYLRWLPVLIALEIWVILEFTRIFLSNIGGAFTHFILKYASG